MNHLQANYEFVRRKGNVLCIRDVGPWDKFISVTNAAERVVEKLMSSGHLGPMDRLIYYDSEGRLDEIIIVDGKFGGFIPWEGAEI